MLRQVSIRAYFWLAHRPQDSFFREWPDGVPLPRKGEDVDLRWPDDLITEPLVVREIEWEIRADTGAPSVRIMLNDGSPWVRPPSAR